MDGSGKTTQVERLRAALEAEGREVVTAREPGQTELGEAIREPRPPRRADDSVGGGAALRRLARRGRRRGRAARRSSAAPTSCSTATSTARSSTRASDAGSASTRCSRSTCSRPAASCPDRTFVLAIEPGTSVVTRRLQAGPDRTRGRGVPRRVAEGYEELAALFPERVVVLDGSLDPDALAERIHGELQRVG